MLNGSGTALAELLNAAAGTIKRRSLVLVVSEDLDASLAADSPTILLDRDVDVVTAALTSLLCCLRNPAAALFWAVLIALEEQGEVTLGVVLIFLIWIAGNIPNRGDIQWMKRGGEEPPAPVPETRGHPRL